jgi:predicted DNA-binding transcriptional regulator YafY
MNAARRERLVRALRRGRQVTVERLARDLGVSRRTLLRDLVALREAGFRVESQAGPGGGVRLDPDSLLVSAELAADEVVALIVSVAVARAAPWIPFAGRADAALAKIEGALAPERIRELRRVMGRILIGEPLEQAGPLSPVDPALLPAFEQAFTGRLLLSFDYVDRAGRPSRRRVEPHALLLRPPIWYIVAWDCLKDAPRLFRMDRIEHPAVLGDAAFGARPLDLTSGVCPDARPALRH